MSDQREAHELRKRYEYEAADRGEKPSHEGYLNYARDNQAPIDSRLIASAEKYRYRQRRRR